MSEGEDRPKSIFLFSGKRKSGKDYVTDRLLQLLNPNEAALIRISVPIKTCWGQANNLDVDELLTSSEYKERYRKELVEWSERIRNSDSGYFCRAALEMFDVRDKPFWIVGDVRRKTDIRWFSDHFEGKIKTIRIVCSDEVRRQRGWTFTEGIDDQETECDLDDFSPWDQTIVNDGADLSSTIANLASQLTS